MAIWAVEPLPFVPVMWMTGADLLGVAEHVGEAFHAIERGVGPPVGNDRLEVLVLVEVLESCRQIHRDGPRRGL